MKLVRENFLLFYLLLILGIVIIELCFGFFAIIYSKKFINKIFEEGAGVSRKKIAIITELLNNSTFKLFSKLRSDLILVGKHMILLKDINPNLNYYQNYKNNKIKKIISSKYEDIISNEILKKYFNNITYQFNYIEKYNSLYENVSNPNIIINSLFNNNNHEELNLISYYNLNYNNNYINNNLDDNTKMIGKYLISILKTLYIDNYFLKKILIILDLYYFMKMNVLFILLMPIIIQNLLVIVNLIFILKFSLNHFFLI